MKDYSLGCYEKAMPNALPLAQKLARAKLAGFDYLEMSVDETDEKLMRLKWSGEERKALVGQMHDQGFFVRSMCLSGHRKFPIGSETHETRSRGMEIMRDAIVLADALGIRIIQIAGYDEYYLPSTPKTRTLFLENLEKSVELAARYGVMLAFETMETEFMNTVEKAMNYVRKIASPYLQVYPDSGNITNAALTHKKDVLADLRTGRGHIAAVHLKETRPECFREIPFGEGHVNFEALIAQALQLGVKRFLGEFWHSGEDWQNDMRQANRFLRKKIEQAEPIIARSGKQESEH